MLCIGIESGVNMNFGKIVVISGIPVLVVFYYSLIISDNNKI